MPAGESEARAKTKARFEEVFKSYAGYTTEKKSSKKRFTPSQENLILETLRNRLDLSKDTEDNETALNNTYNPEEESPRFMKNKLRDRTSAAEKLNNDDVLGEEGRQAKSKKKKKREIIKEQPDNEGTLYINDPQIFAQGCKSIKTSKSRPGLEQDAAQPKKEKKRTKSTLDDPSTKIPSKASEEEVEEQHLIQAYMQQVAEEEEETAVAATAVKKKPKKKLKEQVLSESTSSGLRHGILLNNEVDRKKKKKTVLVTSENETSAMSLSELQDSQTQESNVKKKKSQASLVPNVDEEEIMGSKEQKFEEVPDQPKTKGMKAKRKSRRASGEENAHCDQELEDEGPVPEAVREPQEGRANQTIDDSVVLGVYIHRTDRLKMDLIVSHPMVKVHVVDESTGLYVKKESGSRAVSSFYEQEKVGHIIPIMTQPYYFKKFKSTVPEWQEQVIFNERFGYFLQENENCPKVILFFEILEFLSMGEARMNIEAQNQEKGFRKIAWAFLKLVGANRVLNVNSKLRLQLYYPPPRARTQFNTIEVFEWWNNCSRHRYPSTLYVTVKGLKLPDHINPSVRSMLAIQQEQGTSAYSDLPNEIAGKGSGTAQQGKKTEMKWTKLPGQVCRIPNKHLLSLRVGQVGCFCIRFSHDGRNLAAACADRDGHAIILYEIPSGHCFRECSGHLNIIYDICWSKDDKNFLSASSDGTVRIWKTGSQNGPAEKVLPHPSFVYTAKYHPFAQYLVVTGCYDCVIRVWSIREREIHGHLLQELDGHTSFINTLCFDAEGLRMFSGDSLGQIIIWNTFINEGSQHHPVQQWGIHKEIREDDMKGVPVNYLQLHPNGRRLLIHARDSTLRVMDLRILTTKKYTGAINYREKIHSTFTPCGTFLLSGSEDGVAYVWNAETGDQVAMYSELSYTSPLRDVAFHPHEHMVAFCAFGQNQPILVYIYDRKVAQLEAEAVKGSAGVLSAAGCKGPKKLSITSDFATMQDSSAPLLDRFASTARISMKMHKVKQKLDSVLNSVHQTSAGMDHLYDQPGSCTVSSVSWNLRKDLTAANPVSSVCPSTVVSNLLLPAPSLLSPHSKLSLPNTLGAQLIPHQSRPPQSGGFSPVAHFSRVPSIKLQTIGTDRSALALKVETDGFTPVQETVVALYDYTAHRSDELTIHRSDIIQVLYKDNDNWWFGRLVNGQQGYFPANYVAGEREYEEEQLTGAQNASPSLPSEQIEAEEKSPTPTKMSAVISKLGELKFISEHDTDTESPVTQVIQKKKKKKQQQQQQQPGASRSDMPIDQSSKYFAAPVGESLTILGAVRKKKSSKSVKIVEGTGEPNVAFEPDC
ncbi:jouberin isoform X2 [Latimeria chalumnae]|uniref:jouberin isoform X2 n=1 Tax=Latimeria chalumnae TaxID=7897 RepID=UPI00313D53C2